VALPIVAGAAVVGAVALALAAGGSPASGPRYDSAILQAGVPKLVRRFGAAWGWPRVVQDFCIAAAMKESAFNVTAFNGVLPPPSYRSDIEPLLGPLSMTKMSLEARRRETRAAKDGWLRNEGSYRSCENPVADYTAGSMGGWGMLPTTGLKRFLGTSYACMNPVALFLPHVGMVAWYGVLASLQWLPYYEGTVISGNVGFRSLVAMMNPGGKGWNASRANLERAIRRTGVGITPDTKLPRLTTSHAVYAGWLDSVQDFLRSASLGPPSMAMGVPIETLREDLLSTLVVGWLPKTQPPRVGTGNLPRRRGWYLAGRNFLGEPVALPASVVIPVAPEVTGLSTSEVTGNVERLRPMRTVLVGDAPPLELARVRNTLELLGTLSRGRGAVRTASRARRLPARKQRPPRLRWDLYLWIQHKTPALVRGDSPPEQMPWDPPSDPEKVLVAYVNLVDMALGPDTKASDRPVSAGGIQVGTPQAVFSLDSTFRLLERHWARYPGAIRVYPRDVPTRVASQVAMGLTNTLGVQPVLKFTP